MIDSTEKVNKVCRAIVALKEHDLIAADDMAMEQKWYTHPLKRSKQNKINEIGVKNERILQLLKELRKEIIESRPKKKKNTVAYNP